MDMHTHHRKLMARQAFKSDLGKESVDLFFQHHLDVLPKTYWKEHVGSEEPTKDQVLELLVLRGSWGFNDMEFFDFTLPDEVTDYVLSVHFDEEGVVEEVSMDS